MSARRTELNRIAARLFAERGYQGTSLADLAEQLGVQKPSLYHHIASKEDLLWAIVDRAAAAFELAADRATDETGGADAVGRLAALVEAHVEVVTADPERSSVFVTEWRHLSGGRRAVIAGRRDAYERRVRDLIADGRAVGAFAPVDPALAATFLLTALNGIATWYRPAGRLSADRVADQYVDLALRSLLEDHR